MTGNRPIYRRWRDYRTVSGGRPVKDFLDALSDEDAAEIAQAMKEVAQQGLVAARHLRGDIYEVRAESNRKSFRILFAAEGRFSHVLLSLEGFQKRTQRTPPTKIRLAEQRLADWRQRGQAHNG
jgi:phage-related protein